MEKLKSELFFKTSEELLLKMKETVYACEDAIKYCRKLGISDELINANIDKVYDFARDINYCRKCPGMKNCEKNNPHLCTKITYDDGLVNRLLTPCKEVLKRTEFESQFIVRDFDKAWLDSSLKTLDQTKERKEVVAQYVKFVKENDTTWIYMVGEANTGRSFLAATLCVDAAQRNKGPICFINASTRFKQLADYGMKKQELFAKVLNYYQSAPILVIDDFGNEFKNDFIRDSILFEILSKRNASKLLTIFTSDFSIEDIITLYSKDKASAIRARQIGKLIKNNAKKEISLGEVSVY